jgi:hypothetical protein
VAVQPADLLNTASPAGRLDRTVVWPGVSASKVLAKLAGFLADAAVEAAEITDTTANDRAQKAWAYYRAKDEQFQRMIGNPAQVSDADEGSQAYTEAQIAEVKAERDSWRALFDSILEEETVADAGSFMILQSLRD